MPAPTSGTPEIFVGNGEMAALMRAKDWTQTSLGPPEQWPQALKVATRILLTSRFEMWLGWGPEIAFLYNDAYRPTLGIKHPDGLAKPTPSSGPRYGLMSGHGCARSTSRVKPPLTAPCC